MSVRELESHCVRARIPNSVNSDRLFAAVTLVRPNLHVHTTGGAADTQRALGQGESTRPALPGRSSHVVPLFVRRSCPDRLPSPYSPLVHGDRTDDSIS